MTPGVRHVPALLLGALIGLALLVGGAIHGSVTGVVVAVVGGLLLVGCGLALGFLVRSYRRQHL